MWIMDCMKFLLYRYELEQCCSSVSLKKARDDIHDDHHGHVQRPPSRHLGNVGQTQTMAGDRILHGHSKHSTLGFEVLILSAPPHRVPCAAHRVTCAVTSREEDDDDRRSCHDAKPLLALSFSFYSKSSKSTTSISAQVIFYG